MEERTGNTRLITIAILRNIAGALVCKECAKEEIEGERKRCVEIIVNHFVKQTSQCQDKEETIDVLSLLLTKNARRRTNKILQSSEIKVQDKTIGLGSHTGFCCAAGHNILLSPDLTHPDSNRNTFLHYDANTKANI